MCLCQRTLEEDTVVFGTGVTHRREPLCGCRESSLGPLKSKQLLSLSAVPPVPTLPYFNLMVLFAFYSALLTYNQYNV